ncbi:MAG TPA: DUF3073 domain-containing protein [Mycobacteriales bacterium]
MGRGRAKAKQTKVARELKYSSPGMDLDRLTRDLQSDQHHVAPSRDDEDAAYARWSDEDDDEDSAAS